MIKREKGLRSLKIKKYKVKKEKISELEDDFLQMEKDIENNEKENKLVKIKKEKVNESGNDSFQIKKEKITELEDSSSQILKENKLVKIKKEKIEEKEPKNEIMENPLKKYEKIVAERLNIDSNRNQTLEKLVESKKSKKRTEREEKEQEELALKITTQQEKNNNLIVSSEDSDSEEEKNAKKRKKLSIRAKNTNLKTMKRKFKQPLEIPEPAEDVEIDEDLLISTKGPIIDMNKVPENRLTIYSDTLTEQELSHLSAKELQKEDAKNPLPIQRLFYTEPETREVSSFEKDKELFQMGLINTDSTRDRMSLTITNLKKGLKSSWIPTSKAEFMDAITKSISIVTRKEEEMMMRTPLEGERNCVRDDKCEGRFIPGAKPVTLVEYLDPIQRRAFSETKTLPNARTCCVLCYRYLALYNYANIKAECTTFPDKTIVITKRGNIAGKKGEYVPEQMIATNSKDYQALPFPIVIHCRKNYRQEVRGDATYYVQDYLKPEEVSSELFP